eukprot:CAMPEP_0119416866 /NCGR_PEP_ID=MMETSP1335-20130426/14370_1 /TAXON_ID=259385 /ORGANISM="Chrysoculter rhomboideus, Strain RCC1486" /LENGTH=108 /DNA_ID=CAMNT_0007442011 /DNA_START=177 /DNA_END=502 /DNA_ORIENTATION=+
MILLEGRACHGEARAADELVQAVPFSRAPAKNTSLAASLAVPAHANFKLAKACCALRAVVFVAHSATDHAALDVMALLPAVVDDAQQRTVPSPSIARDHPHLRMMAGS